MLWPRLPSQPGAGQNSNPGLSDSRASTLHPPDHPAVVKTAFYLTTELLLCFFPVQRDDFRGDREYEESEEGDQRLGGASGRLGRLRLTERLRGWHRQRKHSVDSSPEGEQERSAPPDSDTAELVAGSGVPQTPPLHSLLWKLDLRLVIGSWHSPSGGNGGERV